MRSFYLGSLLLCAFLFTARASATGDAEKLTFEFAGNVRTCYFFAPEAGGPLPLVLLLHGSGRNGQTMVDAWKNLAAREHFIVAAPDAFDSSAWNVKMDSPGFLHAVARQVQAKHAIDESRIYLFGHSSGARYALILALLDSTYYAATAVHAVELPSGYDKLFAYAERRIPIAIWVENRDPLFPVDTVTVTKRLFESNGYHVELSIIPNHDHNYYAISDEVNGEVWNFLKKVQFRPPVLTGPH